MVLAGLAHSFLLWLDPERAHNIGKWAMKRRIFAPGKFHTKESETKLFDITLPNPFGIAAGFDKYAELQDVVQDYGFSFIEEGSFTYEGGEGNKKPRLFRIRETGSLLNRMGLNCLSSEEAVRRLEHAQNPYSFAGSIAKTHNPKIIGDKAIDDIINSYKLLRHLGIYTAINISCPNTSEGKTFEEPSSFKDLVSALKEVGKDRPLVFKFSPNLENQKLEQLVEIAEDISDGYEAVNTFSVQDPNYGQGGLSGPDLYLLAWVTIKRLRQLTSKPIIGVGSISTENEALAMQKLGVNVFLTFTGFVYKHKNNPYAGPGFAHKINKAYFDKLRSGY
ncbi:dihydroorotate dehydrogenase 2 [Candidatus Woesearchaeota archaeon]|nr:dihydroorotate dehydrogenase 2 [Candidatus Woesearchaeota archaeon]